MDYQLPPTMLATEASSARVPRRLSLVRHALGMLSGVHLAVRTVSIAFHGFHADTLSHCGASPTKIQNVGSLGAWVLVLVPSSSSACRLHKESRLFLLPAVVTCRQRHARQHSFLMKVWINAHGERIFPKAGTCHRLTLVCRKTFASRFDFPTSADSSHSWRSPSQLLGRTQKAIYGVVMS